MVKTRPKVPNPKTPSPSTPQSQTKKKAAPKRSSRRYSSELQTRSTMVPIIRIFNDIGHQLNQGHLDAMSKTPFFLLFKAIYDKKLTTEHCKKNEKLISSLIERFNKDSQMFKLGSQEVGIHADDVRFVFGLDDGTRRIEFPPGGGKLESRFVNRVFSGVKGNLTMKLLKTRLRVVVNTEGDVAVEDTVRILCLIIISSLFCCTSSGASSWGWVEYVENLEEMKTYDWCEIILNTLVKSMINKHAQNIYVKGCTTLLMYWLCEHATIASPRGSSIPRFLKWCLNDVWKKIDKDILTKLSNDEVIEGALTPTIEELNEYKKLQIVVTQAHSGGENKVEVSTCKENSMYQKIEEKKRKPPKTCDYDYGKEREKPTKSQPHEEHEEVETCNIPVENNYTRGQVKFLEMIDRNSTRNCGWDLPPKCLEKLMLLYKKGKTAPVVHNREKWFHVNVGDILNVMSCRYVNNNVIDAYAHHLLETSNLGRKTFVVQSLCWTSIVKQRPMDSPIYKQVADASTTENAIILFPMLSTGYNHETRPFHWTLLVYDVCGKKYIFYNSMKPRQHKKDAFRVDAEVMKELIEENVGKLLNMDGEFDLLKLETPKDIPQQGAGTTDCGIYVCYYMKQIIQKKKIPKSISKDDLQMFRAEIVKAIVMMSNQIS